MRRKRPSWEDLDKMRFVSAREVCNLVSQHVRYRMDRKNDDWKAAELTWKDGYGDCEDIAILVQYLCRNSNINAQMCILYGPVRGPGHAIVYGRNGNGVGDWFSSNGRFHKTSDIHGAASRELGWKSRVTHMIHVTDDYLNARTRRA